MFMEEKVINGVLHWRKTPDGEFTPYTSVELTAMLCEARRKIAEQADREPVRDYDAMDSPV